MTRSVLLLFFAAATAACAANDPASRLDELSDRVEIECGSVRFPSCATATHEQCLEDALAAGRVASFWITLPTSTDPNGHREAMFAADGGFTTLSGLTGRTTNEHEWSEFPCAAGIKLGTSLYGPSCMDLVCE